MTAKKVDTRIRNPFREGFVTELIDEPARYKLMFSEEILVGETLNVFQPANVALVGPLGTGKSMILNLLRYQVVSEWLRLARRGPTTKVQNLLPKNMRKIQPYLGVYVNLTKMSFVAFGRRSVSMTRTGKHDEAIESACAADFLNHFIFQEFVTAFQHLCDSQGSRLCEWLSLDSAKVSGEAFAQNLARLPCWNGYYADCRSLDELREKCTARLQVWHNFLNTSIDEIPEAIYSTKSNLGEPTHAIAELLARVSKNGVAPPLFVVIDQYEELPALNPTHGTSLQRIVNSLIKRRDHLVFYKIGARTHDWGRELRVWGAESRIEVQRDYIFIDLMELLMREENSERWVFGHLAYDVAFKRLKARKLPVTQKTNVKNILGELDASDEARIFPREESV